MRLPWLFFQLTGGAARAYSGGEMNGSLFLVALVVAVVLGARALVLRLARPARVTV
jgi:hypothetical protein